MAFLRRIRVSCRRICRITRPVAAQTAAWRPRSVTEATAIAPDAKPRLPRGVRLTHNEAQGGWVLLAPERIFKADAIAVEILKRCTGEATLDAIVDDLAKTFNAPRERIHTDVSEAARAGWPRRNCWSCDVVRDWRQSRRRLPSRSGCSGRADAPLSARLSRIAPIRWRSSSATTSSTPRPGSRVFKEAAALGVLQVHLSGGEPGARRDLVEIAALRARGRALHQSHHLGRRHHHAHHARLGRRASTTCRSRSRTPMRCPPTISPAIAARSSESMRWPPKRCGSACRSPSISWCIAPTSGASATWSISRWRLKRHPHRDRACAVLRLGAEEPRGADADRASRSIARSPRSKSCAAGTTAGS